MQIKKGTSAGIAESKISLFLTIYLSAFMFWLGLGIGDNMSDFRFWIQSTWMTIKFEWAFILLYIVLSRRLLSLGNLWKRHRFVTQVVILWLTVVLSSYLLSPYYSWQNPLAYMRLAETITHFLFFLALWDFFNHYDVNYRMIFMAIIISTLVVVSYFIYIHFAFPDLKADRHVFSMRSDELILNTHMHRVGYQVEAAIGFAVAFLFSKNYKYIAALAIGVLFVFMLWLGGRAAILGTVITIIVLFFYFRKNISFKVFMSLGAFLVLLVSIGLYFHLLDLDYFSHAMKKTFQINSLNHLLTGRIEVWSLVLEELHDYWLLGTGPQSYFFYWGRKEDVIHAHNFIVQFLGEWGIIGAVLFGLLLYRAIGYGIVLHLRQPIYPERYQLAVGAVILALTITGLFSGTYFFVQTSTYLAVAFALWLSPATSKKEIK